MSAFGFIFGVRRNDISPELTRLIGRARNPRLVLLAMGNTFKSITEGTFNSVGAAYRPVPWAAKRDGTPSILQASTTLCKAFHLTVTDRTATLANAMIYAAIHQFGGTIKPKNKPMLKFKVGGKWVSKASVRIPARPFFPIKDGRLTAAAETLIARAGERAVMRQNS